MVSFENYKARYIRAYEKYKGRVCIIDPMYDDAKIAEAYNNFTDKLLWCNRAFRPGTLAESNVVYYDYLVFGALRWHFGEFISDERALTMCREQPDEVRRIVQRYGIETSQKTKSTNYI